ncbi:MAG: DUF6531 domain-containing protein [Proteobacteria bacterium]|nr:DUF6531 domain-containing protein [Pseudomonadota bacterium]
MIKPINALVSSLSLFSLTISNSIADDKECYLHVNIENTTDYIYEYTYNEYWKTDIADLPNGVNMAIHVGWVSPKSSSYINELHRVLAGSYEDTLPNLIQIYKSSSTDIAHEHVTDSKDREYINFGTTDSQMYITKPPYAGAGYYQYDPVEGEWMCRTGTFQKPWWKPCDLISGDNVDIIEKSTHGIPFSCNLNNLNIIILPKDESKISKPASCKLAGDPVDVSDGVLKETVTDYKSKSPFPIIIRRFYSSQNGWRFTYTQYLTVAGDSATIYYPDGFLAKLNFCGHGDNANCVAVDNGFFNHRRSDGVIEKFNSSGQLAQLTNRNGLTQTIKYDKNNMTISDDFGGKVVVTFYSVFDQWSVVKLPNNEEIHYDFTWDSHNLRHVYYPNNTGVYYSYNSSYSKQMDSFKYIGNNFANWLYSSSGKVSNNTMVR